MISDLITTFTNNFHYLNSKQTRACCTMFANKELTAALVFQAKSMLGDLKALANNNELGEEEKSQRFTTLVRNTFNSVETERGVKGKIFQPKKNKPLNMLDIKGKEYQGVYRQPYPPGKFEDQLVKGLTAICHAIAAEKQADPAGVSQRFKGQCEQLMQDIRQYKAPERVFTNMPKPGSPA